MRSILIISFFLVSLSSCKSQHYTFNDLPEKQLIFGSGGGITGASDTYTLLENGQLFSYNSMTKEHKELEKLSKKMAKNHFDKMQALALSEMNFNHPGNRYYFLEQHDGEEVHKVTWGSQDHEVSDDCKMIYKELLELIK